MPTIANSKKIDRRAIKRILIRATNWVGDAVMTLPAVEAARESFPDSHIAVLAKPWVVPLFEDNPCVDEVIPYHKNGGLFSNLYEMARVAILIRKQRFDLAILLQNAFEAALLVTIGGVKFKLGYIKDGRGFLLTHGIFRDKEVLAVHQVEYYLSLLRAMDWQAKSSDPKLHVNDVQLQKAVDFLGSLGINKDDFLIGLSPGAIYGEAKRWPPDRFAKIGDWATTRWNAKVLVFGSNKEALVCSTLCESMRNKAFNLCGATALDQAIAIIARCHFFVTNDSGLMHIAAALGIPTVAIFGSTDPVATGPRSPKAKVIQHAVECAPCLKPKCPTDYRCMLSIKPEEVWHVMEKIRRQKKQ